MAGDGLVAPVIVLERFGCRADALMAELLWSQRLLARGHQLINQLPLQCQVTEPHRIARALQARLWNLPIPEAAAAGLRITTSCEWCGRVGILQPSDFLAYSSKIDRLGFIQDMAAACYLCGSRVEHKIVMRHQEIAGLSSGNLEWEH